MIFCIVLHHLQSVVEIDETVKTGIIPTRSKFLTFSVNVTRSNWPIKMIFKFTNLKQGYRILSLYIMFKIFKLLFISILDIYHLYENIKYFLSYSFTSCAEKKIILYIILIFEHNIVIIIQLNNVVYNLFFYELSCFVIMNLNIFY